MTRRLTILLLLLPAIATAQPTSLTPDLVTLGCEWNQSGSTSFTNHPEWDFADGDIGADADTATRITGQYACRVNPKLTSGTAATAWISLKTCATVSPDNVGRDAALRLPRPCGPITSPSSRDYGAMAYTFTINPTAANFPVSGAMTFLHILGSRFTTSNNEHSNPGNTIASLGLNSNHIVLKHGTGPGYGDDGTHDLVADGLADLTLVAYRGSGTTSEEITPEGGSTCTVADVLALDAFNYISVTVEDVSATLVRMRVRVENTTVTDATLDCSWSFAGAALPAAHLYFAHGPVAAAWDGFTLENVGYKHVDPDDLQWILPLVCFWPGATGGSFGSCTTSAGNYRCTMAENTLQEWSCLDSGSDCAAGDNNRLRAVSGINPTDNHYLYATNAGGSEHLQLNPSDPSLAGASYPAAKATGPLVYAHAEGHIAGSPSADPTRLGFYDGGIFCNAGGLQSLADGRTAVKYFRYPITERCDTSSSDPLTTAYITTQARVMLERAIGGASGTSIAGAVGAAVCYHKDPLPPTVTPTITNTVPVPFTPTDTRTPTITKTPVVTFTMTNTPTAAFTSTQTHTPTGGTSTPSPTLAPETPALFHRAEAVRESGNNTFPTKYRGDIRRAFIDACAVASADNPATVLVNWDYTGATPGAATPAPEPKSANGLGLCSYLTVRCVDQRTIIATGDQPAMACGEEHKPCSNIRIEGCVIDGREIGATAAVLDLRGISDLVVTGNTVLGEDADLVLVGGENTSGVALHNNRLENWPGYHAIREVPGGEGALVYGNAFIQTAPTPTVTPG